MRKPRAAVIVASALLATGCTSAWTPRATWTSQHSGKCLSLPVTGGYFAGDALEQWSCSHYHMGLQASWQLESTGTANTYRFVSIFSGMCLEVKTSAGGGKQNGDPLQQATCTTAANQQWLLSALTVGSKAMTIHSVHSKKCMQVRSGTTGGKGDGDAIEQWGCVNGATSQIWQITFITDVPNPPLTTGKGELCNLCNPANPDCKSGALCLVLWTGQSVCGQSCSAGSCPKGYKCQAVKSDFQCVPDGESCPSAP